MKKIIKLLKRNPRRHFSRTKTPIYDLCVVKKSARGRFVYEKLGVYSTIGGVLSINPFRLVFWLSRNVSMTGSAARLFLTSDVLRTPNSEDDI